MCATSQIIQLPTEANPLTLMSGCRDSLSLSITLRAAPPGSAAGFYFESAGSEGRDAHARALSRSRAGFFREARGVYATGLRTSRAKSGLEGAKIRQNQLPRPPAAPPRPDIVGFGRFP